MDFLKKNKAYIIIIAAVLLLEVFLFNYKSFMITGAYTERMIPAASSSNVVSGTFDNKGAVGAENGGVIELELKNLGMKVKTIYVDLKLSNNIIDKKVEIGYKDSTYSEEYRTAWSQSEAVVINGNDRSRYITVNLSGEVKDLRVKVYAGTDEAIKIQSITLNKKVPFHFSIVRFLIILFVSLGVYMLYSCKKLRNSYAKEEKLCKNVFLVMTMATVLLLMFMAYLANSAKSVSMLNALKGSGSGNQISQEIVDAFEAGQVSLLKVPSETMLSLENPYDYSQRTAAGVNNEFWDHCLYDGKYYSYYGIGPVLTLFLPFHKLTNRYFSTIWAVLIYSIIGILCLSKLYELLIKKFFKDIDAGMAIMGHFMMLVSSGIFFSAMRPLFYEIAISSGFAAVAAGACLLISSNVIGEGNIKYGRLAAATSCLGFAVLCRPTTAVYCVASLAFIYYGFVKQLKADSEAKNNTGRIKYLCAALLPYMAFGAIQMWYNYARFDSPLDFGINYSLTINDFTASEFHLHFAVISIFAFIFAAPQVMASFPYVTGSFDKLGLNGFYFVDDSAASGLMIGALYRALPIFGYVFGVKALKKLEKGKRLAPLIFIILTCIVAPLAIVFSTWESGFAVRYYADFAWQMLIGALAIAFFLYIKCKNDDVKKIVYGAFIVMTVLCLIINAGQLYNFEYTISGLGSLVSDAWQCRIYSFARLFNFWL